MKLHIVDDDNFLLESLERNIKHYTDYNLFTSTSGEQILNHMQQQSTTNVTTMIILDINLPDISGLKLCQKLRLKYPHIGIIMYSAVCKLQFKIESFTNGADDYIVKPTPMSELIARLKALERRLAPKEHFQTIKSPYIFKIKKESFTLEENQLLYNKKAYKLTIQHSIILKELLSHTGLISTNVMLQTLTHNSHYPQKKTLATAIYRLKLLLKMHSIPLNIINHYGHGYTITTD